MAACFAQRRDCNLNDVEPVVQILSERSHGNSGSKIAVGKIVDIQIGTQTGLKGTVNSIGKVINPADASSQFGATITTPSIVVNVKLDKPLSAKQFAGIAITAKIEGLSQPVLSILFQI